MGFNHKVGLQQYNWGAVNKQKRKKKKEHGLQNKMGRLGKQLGQFIEMGRVGL